MSSLEVEPLIRMSNDLKESCKALNLNSKGPARMPLKRMRITTRKAPNGEGSKTWDRFQMIIHKWVIKISEGSSEEVKKAMNITLDPRVSISICVRTPQ